MVGTSVINASHFSFVAPLAWGHFVAYCDQGMPRLLAAFKWYSFTARVVEPTRMFGCSAKSSLHKSGGLTICRIWMPLSNAIAV